MKSLILLGVLLIAAGFQSLSAATATSLSQFGITWKFSKAVEYGTFVTGDYYVVDPGGGVVVTSVSPAPAGGRNGSMINPVAGQNASDTKQGYDNRLPYYDEKSSVSFPATLGSGKSLVSSVSLQPSDLDSSGLRYRASWHGHTTSKDHAKLKTAAVLTVLSKAPPSGSFRPPFVGDAKPLFNISQIQRKYLPRLAPPVSAPSEPISYFERGLERPWLTHTLWWEARFMHPVENMHNYHQNIGEFLSEASLVMVTNLSTPTLENRFIQIGIDQYAMVTSGFGDQSYFEWQVMYTGLLLGNSAMANIAKTGSKTPGRVAEKFYYWSGHLSTVTSKIVPAGKTWTGATVFFRKQRGNIEHEHLHPSEWALAADGPDPNNAGAKAERYRQGQDSVPHLGMALTARILSVTDRWAIKAIDDYLTRWMTEKWTSLYAPVVNSYWSGIPNYTGSMGSAFNNEMWNLYKNYTISSVPMASAPQITPAGGLYTTAQDIRLSTSTPGATIYFTLDGTAPTGAAVQKYNPSSIIRIAANRTLKTVAKAAGMADSSIVSADFIIDPDSPLIATSAGWLNRGFPKQNSGVFKAKFVLTPGSDYMDGVFGLSNGSVTGNPEGYSKLATTVRFATSGKIDARNGDSYMADKAIAYTKGTPYNIEFRVNMATESYDVFVDGVQLATNYRFRDTAGPSGDNGWEIDNFAGFSSLSETFMTVRSKMSFLPPLDATPTK